jgi:hypothetical protein
MLSMFNMVLALFMFHVLVGLCMLNSDVSSDIVDPNLLPLFVGKSHPRSVDIDRGISRLHSSVLEHEREDRVLREDADGSVSFFGPQSPNLDCINNAYKSNESCMHGLWRSLPIRSNASSKVNGKLTIEVSCTGGLTGTEESSSRHDGELIRSTGAEEHKDVWEDMINVGWQQNVFCHKYGDNRSVNVCPWNHREEQNRRNLFRTILTKYRCTRYACSPVWEMQTSLHVLQSHKLLVDQFFKSQWRVGNKLVKKFDCSCKTILIERLIA